MTEAPDATPTWVIEPLDPGHDRASFDCGEPALNDFLHALARQQQDKHVGKTFVAVPKRGVKRVVGFYTVSAGSIQFAHLPADVQKHLPRYPVPVARLGRLAVDGSMHGQGLGAALLRDALLRVARVAATELGILGVVVDAKNAEARKFYERYGFVPLPEHPLTLIILTGTILAAATPSK
jgi:GNAT superfamily N-acetyltransferase